MGPPRKTAVRLMTGAALGALLLTAPQTGRAEPAEWAPVASERLVRLPAAFLERAIDRDFDGSSLAEALRRKAEAIAGTASSLAERQAEAESAQGPDRDEARHRFLVAKQDYVTLMGARQDLDRRRVETRLALYRRLLSRIERAGDPAAAPDGAALAERRAAAMERFAGSVEAVDMKLFASATVEESRYAREYARHAAAIDDLVRAIAAHPMNAAPQVEGRAVGKAEYLHHLVAAAEADLALLDQKDLVLAYMAKLVALDAMALADEVDARAVEERSGGAAGAGRVGLRDVTAAVGFFTLPN